MHHHLSFAQRTTAIPGAVSDERQKILNQKVALLLRQTPLPHSSMNKLDLSHKGVQASTSGTAFDVRSLPAPTVNRTCTPLATSIPLSAMQATEVEMAEAPRQASVQALQNQIKRTRGLL